MEAHVGSWSYNSLLLGIFCRNHPGWYDQTADPFGPGWGLAGFGRRMAIPAANGITITSPA
jgi:hypothetical protein